KPERNRDINPKWVSLYLWKGRPWLKDYEPKLLEGLVKSSAFKAANKKQLGSFNEISLGF
ncbi:MAG: hypothetical protein ACM3NO_00205, partial [Deltaproteobacteria bacterium]